MRILKASDRVATPWKNGGGVTTEIAVFPQGAGFDDFGWRISAAQVAQGGPFSTFPGIDRKLAILEGRMKLAIAGIGDLELSRDTAPAEFPGDAATNATVLKGPVLDLNVMTRRDRFTSRLTRQKSSALAVDPRAATMIFALTPMTVMQSGKEVSLTPHDVAIVEPGDGQIALDADADFYRIEVAQA